jgi:hypothetical protein
VLHALFHLLTGLVGFCAVRNTLATGPEQKQPMVVSASLALLPCTQHGSRSGIFSRIPVASFSKILAQSSHFKMVLSWCGGIPCTDQVQGTEEIETYQRVSAAFWQWRVHRTLPVAETLYSKGCAMQEPEEREPPHALGLK